MLLELCDPLVGRQLIVLVVGEDVDPQEHIRLALELGFQSHQELVEVVLPGMADEDVGHPDLSRGGGRWRGGLSLSEQLAVGEASCSATAVFAGLRDALHDGENVSSGAVVPHLALYVFLIEGAHGRHGDAIRCRHHLSARRCCDRIGPGLYHSFLQRFLSYDI